MIDSNSTAPTNSFVEVIELIKQSRKKAFASINREIIDLYWRIGEYIRIKVEIEKWGKSTVEELANSIHNEIEGIKGFSAQNLWRMKQFVETYKPYPKLSTLLRELSWSNNLHILSKTKTIEEKEFYINLTIKEKYSARELERQINASVYERFILSDKQLPSLQREEMECSSNMLNTIFMDTYVFEFLDLPKDYSELEFRQSLIKNLKNFILEFGRDFSLVGEEYRIQIGNKDFHIDILLFNRSLQCLVAVELKVDDFKPEYLGKIDFYLEALDQKIKLPHENPSVGLLLCKTKDDEVVKYSLNRNLSPTMIAEYETKLIDKNLLRQKMHQVAEYFQTQNEITLNPE
ncbi:MAG: PDDEXK nuclease domain-containing protein [bacterium]